MSYSSGFRFCRNLLVFGQTVFSSDTSGSNKPKRELLLLWRLTAGWWLTTCTILNAQTGGVSRNSAAGQGLPEASWVTPNQQNQFQTSALFTTRRWITTSDRIVLKPLRLEVQNKNFILVKTSFLSAGLIYLSLPLSPEDVRAFKQGFYFEESLLYFRAWCIWLTTISAPPVCPAAAPEINNFNVFI